MTLFILTIILFLLVIFININTFVEVLTKLNFILIEALKWSCAVKLRQ